MFRPLILVTLLLAIAAAAPGAAPHPSLPPPVIPDCLGVNIHFTDPRPGELEMLAAAGFKWVRTELDWAAIERRPGENHFSAYDKLVAALQPFKIRVVFVLGHGNPLYVAPTNTPEFRDAFGKWAIVAVEHFQRHGFLWEMWNEPNGSTWKSPDKTADSIALAKSTGDALRRAGLLGAKGEAFIGPATDTIDLPYLEACFQAGLLDYWDAVSVHPYRLAAPETTEAEYRRLRLLIHQYAPKDKVIPIIASECGYSDSSPASSPDRQAAYLGRQFMTNIANDVALSIWSDWRDDPAHPKEDGHHFGLVGSEYHLSARQVFDPTPAYQAMKTIRDHLGHFTYNKRLSIESAPEAFVLLFEREKEVRLATWTSGEAGTTIKIPASHGAVLTFATDGTRTDSVMTEPTELILQPSSSVAILEFPQTNPLLQIGASITRLPLETIFDMPGQSPPFRFTLTNASHDSVFGRFIQQENQEDPKVNPVLTGLISQSQMLGPHRTLETKLTFTSGQRAIDGDQLVLGAVIASDAKKDASRGAAYFQATRLIPANPWTITRLPDAGNDVVFLLENPSGLPWKGSVQIAISAGKRSAGWGGGSRNQRPQKGPVFASPSVKLEVLPKVRRLTFHIPADRGLGSNTWWRGFDQLGLFPEGGKAFQLPIADNAPVILDVANVQAVADGDPKVTMKLSRKVEQPPDGTIGDNLPSIRVDYSFTPGWKCLRVVNPTWPPPGEKNLLGQPKSLSIWIDGDGKGCVARMRFVDSTNQFFQSSGPRVDWKGWRQVTFPMHRPEDPLEHWDGADDGEIHYPIELDSILVLDNATREPVEGTIYVAAPTLNF